MCAVDVLNDAVNACFIILLKKYLLTEEIKRMEELCSVVVKTNNDVQRIYEQLLEKTFQHPIGIIRICLIQYIDIFNFVIMI